MFSGGIKARMYLIDKKNNRLSKIEDKTFSELGFKERKHLQEWLANEPAVFGEDLLVIQKEFSGFADTKERLDLLLWIKTATLKTSWTALFWLLRNSGKRLLLLFYGL